MSWKSLLVISVLSIITTYGLAIFDLIFLTKRVVGLPFGFTSLGFPSGETNELIMILDIIFWFIVIFTLWKAIPYFSSKKTNKKPRK